MWTKGRGVHLIAAMFSAILLKHPGLCEGISGASASRWQPRTGWVTNGPTRYSVGQIGGRLVFVVRGAGRELPWALDLSPGELDPDSRYLLVRYRAWGVANSPGNYVLHGIEGTPGGRTYLPSEAIITDGKWRTVGVDLRRLAPSGPTTGLAIKVIAAAQTARLEVERIWSADELPDGAASYPLSEPSSVRRTLTWDILRPQPSPSWVPNPGEPHLPQVTPSGCKFVCVGAGRAMRWTATLPEPVDLAVAPVLTLRYRLTGAVEASPYVLWLGVDPSGAGGASELALMGSDLVADGQWHVIDRRLTGGFRVTHLAVGLDSVDERAVLELGPLTFSSRPVTQPLNAWLESNPVGAGTVDSGWVVTRGVVRGGRKGGEFWHQLGVEGWFSQSNMLVNGVPFRLPERREEVRYTGTAAVAYLEADIPRSSREIYLLTAVRTPPAEPFGVELTRPRAVHRLDQPEQMVVEILYSEGPSDLVIPVEQGSGAWGFRRGLGVHVVRPDPTRQPVRLRIHDRMQNASVALLAVTGWKGTPRVPVPHWGALSHALQADDGSRTSGEKPIEWFADISTESGLMWNGARVSDLPGVLTGINGPVFTWQAAGRVAPPAEWRNVRTEMLEGGVRYVQRHDAMELEARVDVLRTAPGEVRLRLTVQNTGKQAVTGTIRFPEIHGIQLGKAEDTWYLYGLRGGIVQNMHASFRDPLGERHPLQVDGFFDPGRHVALTCMTHDTGQQHHFRLLSHRATGGSWSIEYPDRTIEPGATFQAAEASLSLRTGGWRTILAVYRDWLNRWFTPTALKPKWDRAFAFITRGAHYDMQPDARDRGRVQPAVDLARRLLGECDFVHLFGWGASRTYGDWGDYSHYEETVGGKSYFADNIASVQRTGCLVGLYIDGYLSSDKGQVVGSHARSWAMLKPDGAPQYVPEYAAYNQCPYLAPWQEHLLSVYRRVQSDFRPDGLYIDEFGATNGNWICHSPDHGHNPVEIPYTGELTIMRRLRDIVGPETALYTEYPPSEAARAVVDGSFTYQALWSVDQQHRAPHFIDLPRFLFPKFKQFHIIHYTPMRNGNWWVCKFPFFNGEGYNLGEPNLLMADEPSLEFHRRAMKVLCAHRDAFSSEQVEPLVSTLQSGVFANRFLADRKQVWTLYNANGRTVRRCVLRVKHIAGAIYRDAWNARTLDPEIHGGFARIALDLGPRDVGCVIQQW